MPVNYPDFGRISFDEANPVLKGAKAGQDLMQNFMKFPQDLQAKILANAINSVKAKYAEPMAAQALTKATQENQWNPKIWESEINLRGAESGLAGAESGKLGVETNKLNYFVNMLKQKIAESQSQGGAGAGDANSSAAAMGYGENTEPNQLSPQGGADVGGGAPDGGGVDNSSPSAAVGGSGMGGGAAIMPGGASPTGGEQGMPGGGQAAPQANNSYFGIPTPKPTTDDIINKNILGLDTFTPKLTMATNQQAEQQKKYMSETSDAIKSATQAQTAKQLFAQFNDAMNKSAYRGQAGGNMASSGWHTLFTGDMSNEQIADRMATNLLPSAMAEVREAMKSGQFSVADLNQSQKMKVDRTMDDETRKVQTDWLNGVQNRLEERAKFLTVMGNPRSQAQIQQADMLWQNYQEQNPIISPNGKVEASHMGNWPLYTTPKAIQSIKETGSYTPPKNAKGSFYMHLPPDSQNPQGRIVPIKPGMVEEVLKRGGRPL